LSYEPEEWAKQWLLRKREEGETGLTVERRGNSHYVRWATTVWDPVEKKRKKISEYRGRLTEDGVLHPPEPREDKTVVEVRNEGLPKILAKAADGLVGPLRSHFPDLYPELLALSFCKCAGKTQLRKANTAWNNMLDVLGLKPRIHPGSLAKALKAAGKAKGARNAFFDDLRKGIDGTGDISVRLFDGNNAFVVKGRQDSSGTELAYVCFMEPERASIAEVVSECDLARGTVAVLGGRVPIERAMDLADTGTDFSVEADRESEAFDGIRPDAGSFLWEGGAITYGRGTMGGRHVYVFDDLARKSLEIVNEHRRGLGRSRYPGRTVVVSTVDADPKAVYSWHMGRNAAERYFLGAGAVLDSDSFPWDGDGLDGNDFVALLSMMMMLRIEGWISDAGLEGEMTADDVLDTYASVKSVSTEGGELDVKVGEDVVDLDGKLGLGLYFGKKKRRKRRQPVAHR